MGARPVAAKKGNGKHGVSPHTPRFRKQGFSLYHGAAQNRASASLNYGNERRAKGEGGKARASLSHGGTTQSQFIREQMLFYDPPGARTFFRTTLLPSSVKGYGAEPHDKELPLTLAAAIQRYGKRPGNARPFLSPDILFARLFCRRLLGLSGSPLGFALCQLGVLQIIADHRPNDDGRPGQRNDAGEFAVENGDPNRV